ncbi:MAG: hypothetical protein JO165_12310, partial [Candidatus Eremiobacteraeota bacterium]|nr:hypothetical protein [Candidatus Eremiobacteraeota bacterium]
MNRAIVFVIAMVPALLTGCGSGPHQSQPQRLAYADVEGLLPQHPFYSQLRHYDEQINALQATMQGPDALSNQALARDVARLQQDLDASAQAMENVASHADRYERERRSAIAEILALPPAPSSAGESVEDAMLRTYAEQQARLRIGAARDMAMYGRDLTSQQNQAYRAYVRGVEARLARGYAMRAQQLREQQGTLALDLARNDMQRRLSLQLRLRTLALNAGRRHAVAEELRAIDAREAAIVARQRSKDEAILSAYRQKLESEGRTDIASMAATLEGRARTNVAERQKVYAAQADAATAGLPVPRARANPPAPPAR